MYKFISLFICPFMSTSSFYIDVSLPRKMKINDCDIFDMDKHIQGFSQIFRVMCEIICQIRFMRDMREM
jgi:hypothetical protein